MVFRKRKERTDRSLNELRLGEFWLMPGEFRKLYPAEWTLIV